MQQLFNHLYLYKIESQNLLTGVRIVRECEAVHIIVGRAEEKKCSPIDSGILGAHADIYRSLLGQKIQLLTF